MKIITTTRPKFPSGMICTTPGAADVASLVEMATLLDRHLGGDWGDLVPEDVAQNEWAVKHGGRVLSSYSVHGEKLWIITEADRSSTTVLRPCEY